MTRARGRVGDQDLGAEPEDREIPWLETDGRRAPLRNDLVTALQFALSPVVFWFIFFDAAYHDIRTDVDATVIAMLIAFGASFIVTWGRMASARRHRATTRSPRSKARLAVVVGLGVGVATLLASEPTYPDRAIDAALAVTAAVSAGVILLVLESFALSIPAAERRPRRKPTDELD
jgi:hypothetical protein